MTDYIICIKQVKYRDWPILRRTHCDDSRKYVIPWSYMYTTTRSMVIRLNQFAAPCMVITTHAHS